MKSFIQRSISHATLSLRVPLTVAIALEIISGLQITHLILKTMTQYNDNYDENFFPVAFVNYALSYIGEISPSDLLEESNSFLMCIWVLFAIYFGIHVITFFSHLIAGIIHPQATYTRILKTMSWAYLIHSRLIFFVAHFFFMALINSYNNCAIEGKSSFYCKTLWFAPTVLLCVFNIFIALIKELVLYQVLKNKDAYAVKNNLFHQIMLLYKGVIIILYFLIQSSTSRAQVCAVMNLVFVILLLMAIYMKFPLYNLHVLKTSIAITGIILSFCLLAILQIFGVKKTILDVVWIAVIPLVVKSAFIVFEIISNKVIKGEFDTPEKALYFLSLLKGNQFGYLPNSLCDKNCSLGSIISNGILINQNFDMEKLKGIDSWREYEERIYLHLVERLTTILEKSSNSRVLLLTMAHVCLKKLDNIPRTILLLKKLESLSLSLPVKTSLDALNKKLNAYHTKAGVEDHEKHLKLLAHFEYKDRALALQKTMQFEVQKHIEFWDEMKKENVDVKKVIDISCEIDNSALQVQRIFESQFRGFTQHFVNPLMMYGAYLELVKEYSDDARNLIKQFWSLARGQARGSGLDVYCEEVGVAIVSIEKNNLGAILDASGSMQTLFQVDKQKLLGQQITFILPDFAANYLIRIIRNYAKIPSRKLDHKINTYGKQKDGNFFELEVELKLYPQIDREVKLMLLFRKIAPPKSIIIVNTEGIILDASESLKHALNITLKTKSIPMRFQDISPEFDAINTAFNQEYSNEEGTAILRSFSSKLPSVRSSRFTNHFEGGDQSMHASISFKEPKKRTHSSKFATNIMKRQESKNFTPVEINSPGSIQDKYKDLCAEYSQGGLIQIRNTTHLYSPNAAKRESFPFELQVAPCQLNGEVYKILTLTNTNESNEKKLAPLGMTLEHAKSNVVFSVAETGESEFADQFSEVDERVPQYKTSIHNTPAKEALVADKFTKKFTVFSNDNGVIAPSQQGKKESAKTPDLEPFIQAHAPSKGFVSHGKLARQSRSVSSTSSRTIASVKALKGAFGRDATFHVSKRTTILLLLLVTTMIALGILNYSMSISASTQVKTGVSIVNVASLRLSLAMRGWQFATRVWLRYLKLRSGDIASLQGSFLDAGNQLLEYNRQFTGNLSALTDKSLFTEIMASNIHLWDLNQTFTTTGGLTDSVTATSILANKMIMLGNTSRDIYLTYLKDQVTYLCNNTNNDYLIASETLIAATQKMLQSTLSNNIANLQLVLGLEIAAVVVLCILLVIVARIVIQLYQRLFRALVKIDERFLLERASQLQKIKTLLAENIEIRGYGVSIFEDTQTGLTMAITEKAKSAKSTGTMKRVNFHKASEKVSVLRLFIDLAKYVMVSLGVIQIVTALFVVSLTRSLASFRNSQEITNQLSVTTNAASTASIIVSSMYMNMDFRNDTTMKARNMDLTAELLLDTAKLSSVNSDVMSVFTTEGSGITDAFIQDIFQGVICSYLATDSTTQGYCVTATNNNQLGLLAMNSKLMDSQNMYVTQFLANPTYSNALSLISGYIAVMRPIAETLQSTYQLINAHIIANFNDDNTSFRTQITALHVAILVAILIATFVVIRVTISRFRFLDTRRGNILKVLSYKMLLEDKAIGFYLNRHFVSSDGAFTRSL